MHTFWNDIQRPIIALAPMADVTDPAFRRIIANKGAPDVFWTEFVSADGLYHTRELQKLPDSKNPLMLDMVFDVSEHPIVLQIFSSNPDTIAYASRLAVERGFDGVDINMGCPDRSVEKQGAGAALMKDSVRARELIRAAKHAVGDNIPVSVKTRIGYNKNELSTWLPEILAEEPALVTVHARTRKEMSAVPARWEHVREAVSIRDSLHSPTLILGNGDVLNVAEAHERVKETGADGVMIGRGIFGDPWLFSETTPTHNERMLTLAEHCRLFEDLCAHKSFAVMKKHFKAYVRDFDGAAELRATLMEANNATEVAHIIEEHLKQV